MLPTLMLLPALYGKIIRADAVPALTNIENDEDSDIGVAIDDWCVYILLVLSVNFVSLLSSMSHWN